MKKLSIASAALVMGASAAFASGPTPVPVQPMVVAPAAPAFNWGGFYGGVNLGYGSSNYDLSATYESVPPSVPINLGINLPDLGGRGALGGIQLGYNFMVSDTVVAGLQLDGVYTAINNGTAINLTSPGPNFDFEYTLAPRTMLTVAGRLGMLTNPDTMVYGLVGYTRGNFRGSYTVDFGGGPISDSYSWNRNGVSVGLGIETRVGSNSTLGLEYRHTQFQRYSFFDGPVGFTANDNLEIGFNTSVQTIRAFYNIHF